MSTVGAALFAWERRRPAGWGLALINGYSSGKAGGTPNAIYFFVMLFLSPLQGSFYFER